MEQQEAERLIEKYRQGICTPQEAKLVERWYLQEINRRAPGSQNLDYSRLKTEIWQTVDGRLRPPRRLQPGWIAAAAVLLVCLSVFLYYGKKTSKLEVSNNHTAAIHPGSNKAILILSGGRKVDLQASGNGEIEKINGTMILKTSNGELRYQKDSSTDKPANAMQLFNEIQTPKGGQYKVVLPDGTQVWLNAASSLKYPVAFHQHFRRVELQGEGYFEVAHNPAVPFQIQTTGQLVQVLGTHLEINAYMEQGKVRTTLLEGSVRVLASSGGAPLYLQPGQQAILQGGNLSRQPANIEEVMSWKNGYFRFNNTPMKEIMDRIALWYDVEVVFQSDKKNICLNGTISREKNIKQVLEMLEATHEVHFKIEGRRIIIE